MDKKHMLAELKKLEYMYGINTVIRFERTRKEGHITQSVAEHVTNILMCAHFFKDKIKDGKRLDMGLVARLAMIHDIGEIETGDILTIKKSVNDSEHEQKIIRSVARKVPLAIGKTLVADFDAIEHGNSLEGRFVRAMDKFEGFFFQTTHSGIKMIRVVTPNVAIRKKYIMSVEEMLSKLGFPEVARYAKVVCADAIRRGYLKNV